MKSTDKIIAIKEAMLRTDEEFDGMLGMMQGIVAVDVASGRNSIEHEITDLGFEHIDEELLSVAGFVLWLRSDDAPAIDVADVIGRMPTEIAQLIAAAGIGVGLPADVTDALAAGANVTMHGQGGGGGYEPITDDPRA